MNLHYVLSPALILINKYSIKSLILIIQRKRNLLPPSLVTREALADAGGSWNTDHVLPASLRSHAAFFSPEDPLGENWTVPKLEPTLDLNSAPSPVGLSPFTLYTPSKPLFLASPHFWKSSLFKSSKMTVSL